MSTKAILITEMPESCASCKFTLSHICDGGKLNIVDLWNGTGDFIEGTLRHISCPLKPMPHTKDVGYPNNDYDVGFGDGWDACLREIEK